MKKTAALCTAIIFTLTLLLITACSPKSDTASTQSSQNSTPAEKQLKVGIVQIVEHPALDAAREGFVAQMSKNGFEKDKNISYDVKSAQGNMDTALSIVQKFKGDQVDLILAIATPTAQAAVQTTQDIPVVFTAVTDPVEAGLVKSMDKPEGNATGTTDMNPIKEQLELLKKIKADAKTVGVIYNSGEVNSKVQVDIAKAASQELGLTIQESTITNATEVKQAAESMIGKVDAFYVPTDNMVVSSLAAILTVAEQHKIPVIAGEENSVKSGAIATFGIDYGKLGEQTADMAVKILKDGAKPADMPVEKQAEMKLVINTKAAQNMGVTLPQDLVDTADEVVNQ